MYVSDRADPSGVLLRAKLNCWQWQQLPTDDKHRLVDYHYSAFGLTMNALGRSQIVSEVNRYCEAVRGSWRPRWRPAGAVMQNPDGSFSSDVPVNSEGNPDTPSSGTATNAVRNTGSNDAKYLDLFSKFLQGIPGAVSGIVGSLNETERTKLQYENQQAIARINAQASQTNNAAQQQSLNSQLSLLTQFQSLLNPPKSPMPYIVAGLGVAAVVVVALLANRKRR